MLCSRHPEWPGMPPFWILVSMYLFAKRKVVSLSATTDQNIFPSMSSREISLNWFTSFGTNSVLPGSMLMVAGVEKPAEMIEKLRVVLIYFVCSS